MTTSKKQRSAQNPFAVRGTISVRDSATVVCVRRRKGAAATSAASATPLTPADCGSADSPFFKNVFGPAKAITFSGDWEVLLGQAEVVNWLRSTPDKLAMMRYGGEWKLAGGNVDKGETIRAAAQRELVEEFLAPIGFVEKQQQQQQQQQQQTKEGGDRETDDQRFVLRPFVTKQTRAVRSRSNLMHCFIALEEENGWLRDLEDVSVINAGLEAKRQKFAAQAADADGKPTAQFWALSKDEREEVTPEVREVRWLPLREAVRSMLSSMAAPGTTAVNDFQRAEFAKYGKTRRDPMFITAAILMELEGFPDVPSIVDYCESVDLTALTRAEQWLFEGMDQADVDEAFARRLQQSSTGINPSFKTTAILDGLRRARAERRRRAAGGEGRPAAAAKEGEEEEEEEEGKGGGGRSKL